MCQSAVKEKKFDFLPNSTPRFLTNQQSVGIPQTSHMFKLRNIISKLSGPFELPVRSTCVFIIYLHADDRDLDDTAVSLTR